MSILASFYAVPEAQLDALVSGAPPEQHGRVLDPNEGSGYDVAVLLSWLDEHGTPLMSEEDTAVANALTEGQGVSAFLLRAHHGGRIAGTHPDPEGMRAFFEEFTEVDDPEAGDRMADALATLQRHLSGLDEGTALLITLG